MQRELDSETRFDERVKKNIDNNQEKKEKKHEQWQSKMDKRLARNKVSDEKRVKRIRDRANARNDNLLAEKQDTNQRRTRRKEHFLLSYQSTWSEIALAEATESNVHSEFVAPEIQAAEVGVFVQGETGHLNNMGENKTTSVTVIRPSEASKAAQEFENAIAEKARLQLEADLLEGADDFMKDVLGEDASTPSPAPTPAPVASAAAAVSNEDKQEKIMELEIDLETLEDEQKVARKKFHDCQDF